MGTKITENFSDTSAWLMWDDITPKKDSDKSLQQFSLRETNSRNDLLTFILKRKLFSVGFNVKRAYPILYDLNALLILSKKICRSRWTQAGYFFEWCFKPSFWNSSKEGGHKLFFLSADVEIFQWLQNISLNRCAGQSGNVWLLWYRLTSCVRLAQVARVIGIKELLAFRRMTPNGPICVRFVVTTLQEIEEWDWLKSGCFMFFLQRSFIHKIAVWYSYNL